MYDILHQVSPLLCLAPSDTKADRRRHALHCWNKWILCTEYDRLFNNYSGCYLLPLQTATGVPGSGSSGSREAENPFLTAP